MVELDKSTISKDSTTFSNQMTFGTELNVLSTLGDNTRWSNKNNVFSLFTGELCVTSRVDNTRSTNDSSKCRWKGHRRSNWGGDSCI